MGLNVRAATRGDAAAIAALIREVVAISNAADYPPEVLLRVSASFTADLIERRIASTFVLVAEAEGRLVGTGSLGGTFMRSLFVAPPVQRRGIGATLCDAIEDEAARQGLDAIDVQSSLTARHFYARRGYRLMSETTRDGEPILMMRKRLR